jgi:hypothetical protein
VRANCRIGTAPSNPYFNLRFSRKKAATWLPRSMAAFFLTGLDWRICE